MKKIYSYVLMVTALLIGTNAWALHPSQVFDPEDPTISVDEAKVKIGDGAWQYATTLKEAFDAVQPGETAQIELLKSVNLGASINMPATITSAIMAGTCQNITLNLGESNYSITAPEDVTAFRIMKGTLNITGEGTIQKESVNTTKVGGNLVHDKSVWDGQAVILIAGAEDPSAANWSNLTIGEHVTVSIDPSSKNGVGIIIQDHDGVERILSSDPLYSTKAGIATKYGYCTYYYDYARDDHQAITEDQVQTYCNSTRLPMLCGAFVPTNKPQIQQGSAFGVNVSIAGKIYAGKRPLQIVGHVNQKPSCTEGRDKRDPVAYPTAPYFQYKYPYIKIESTATLSASKNGGASGIYAAGYGVFDIAGTVEGASGVYMKAGDVKLEGNAQITSTFEGVPAKSNGGASGINDAGGSAIVIESNDAYAGGSGLNITGNAEVTGAGGYGIYEETYKADETTTTSHVTVEGGTIQSTGYTDQTEGHKDGNGAIAITATTQAQDKVVVEAGNIDGTVTSGTTVINVADLLPNNSEYKTEIVDGVVTVTKGNFAETTTSVIALVGDADAATKTVTWNNSTVTSERLIDNLTVKELVINQDYDQVLIIGDHANSKYVTFSASRILLGSKAQIIVEPGSSLIVTGNQGIYANVTSNIVLKSADGKQARFFFNPLVNSNSHPKATVEFVSKSWISNDETEYQWERFGIPTWTTLESIEGSVTNTNIQIFENKAWQDLGMLHKNQEFANVARLNKPFITCNLLSYKLTPGGVYTMKGALVGNDNASLNTDLKWNPFANSYSADIDVTALLTSLAGATNIEQAVYLGSYQGQGQYYWSAINPEWAEDEKLAPMQAFIIKNGGEEEEAFALNYNNLVWSPVFPGSNDAPRRTGVENENSAKMRIFVANEHGTLDDVKMTESANVRNIEKYINDDVNIYAHVDGKSAIVAAEDLENMYIGFSTVKGGEYTLSFANVEGREFDLIDLATDARVSVKEDATYTFTAAANTVNDYRFKLVERQNAPTAIENTEAVKSAKGIYTITGQYVGEMNVWNTLPAGVYVINGEKRVK